MENIGDAAAIFQAAPARDDAHAAQKVAGVVPRHADGDDVRLALYGLLQLQNGQVILKGGRLVVLVNHHPFHLKEHIYLLVLFRYFFSLRNFFITA